MTQKEKILFLAKLIDDNNLYPDRVIISRLGYGYVITDFDKIVDITNKRIGKRRQNQSSFPKQKN